MPKSEPSQTEKNRYVDCQPSIHPTAFVAQGAQLIGAITISEQASVWFNAVIRADDEPITIGRGSNIQDGCIVHIDPGQPTIIGSYVTVGHGAIVHGAKLADNVMIGIGATVLTGVEVGSNSIIGAGAVVTEGTIIPPNSLVVGIPGKAIKKVSTDQEARIIGTAQTYIERGRRFAIRDK